MTELYYGVWCLVLQLSAYVSYLDFGLQSAVGRYVAFANAKNDRDARDSIVSTAFVGLVAACVVSAVIITGAALMAGHLFPRVPVDLLPSMRWALLIVGVSIALGLPASAWNGVFVGLQMYELPALTGGGAKLLSALAVTIVAFRTRSLIDMAIGMAAVNLISYALQYWLFKLLAGGVRLQWKLVRRSAARELGSYCFGMTVWSFAMVLVSGLDLMLVGRFDLANLAPYAIASSLVTFIIGSQCAIFTGMMPQAAVVHAAGNADKLGELVLSSTRIGTVLLMITGPLLFLYSKAILDVWVGVSYAAHAQVSFSILLLAAVIRLIWVPYSVVVMGTGQQKALTVAPLLEGFSNLFASVFLGSRYGAFGIACGTLVGAVVGSLAGYLYNIGRTRKQIELHSIQFLRRGVIEPSIVAVPILLLFLVRGGNSEWPVTLLAFAATAALGIAVSGKWAKISTALFRVSPLTASTGGDPLEGVSGANRS